ncbi:hypothetical protein OL239_10150 [Arthrobacter sp. ATA002]|uniref:Clp protease N-terminal domain-containing protein n=1 Tax=Arthrobacter sp. ATA002 TaxID=2991715 RepID=UPI0022A7F330|nr:Clp protease N-terminal domain-containing protein [Arthrobacter sp. ATA002]WAP50431.1 hypothetical protein OL239_10150 [Arthrobacter sp. ATA002]
MFERFTQNARAVVIGAQEQARLLGDTEIGADHMLLGVLASGDNAAVRVLHRLGIEREAIAGRARGLGTADAEALENIGVDLEAVRSRAEASFGPGALDRPERRRQGFLGRRGGGAVPFTAAAKEALVESLKQSRALGRKDIRVEHLLLGLIAQDSSAAARTLRVLGTDPGLVREELLRDLGRSA